MIDVPDTRDATPLVWSAYMYAFSAKSPAVVRTLPSLDSRSASLASRVLHVGLRLLQLEPRTVPCLAELGGAIAEPIDLVRDLLRLTLLVGDGVGPSRGRHADGGDHDREGTGE